MTLYFSAERTAFFDSAIHRELPADAVEISAEQHEALLAGNAEGQRIAADRRGHPCLLKPQPFPLAERRARAQRRARSEARRRILAFASLERQANDSAALAMAALQIAQAGATIIETAEPLGRRTRIDAIRAACAVLEERIETLSAQALSALDVTASSHWPNQE